MSNPIIPVILSGGSGSRLWPLSRESYPKQFLPLVDELTLLQQTVLRAKFVTEINPIIMCNQQHRFLLAEQLTQIQCEADIILEPCGKNTAPAVTIAAMSALQYLDDPILLVLAADHIIENQEIFLNAVMAAKKCAIDGYLTTFGIQPNKPETNYGYIQTGKKLNDQSFLIEKFIEKPSLEKAKEYLADGHYFWNSGMFVFKAKQFLDEIKAHNVSIYNQSKKAFDKITSDLNFKRLPEQEFSDIKSDSIDYAVMEKCKKSAVVPLHAGWSDVGLWMALFEKRKLDEQGNSLEGDVLVQDVKDSFISAHSRLVTAVGVQNLIIIETADAVLVADKHQAHEVKKIVESLKLKDRKEAHSHKKIFRPWGFYETLVDGERYHVKRLMVSPGKSLSLQLHYHRAEHWTVVRGAAQVTCGEKTFLLSENESTYIPVGTRHRLENQGRIPLEIIEVQTGSYLDEDDIVRFEDHYGRAAKIT